ncbi:COX15/CtaA family protein [Hymenobacter sp. BT175]|uniref:COX15/CtaA family protein n=1 Tax=Hymenobacter translucens TaxID=2886507 RepID=UPI001D0E6C34|nr:COX15/CtaA family protein [Hymenobacter translucens]MCC2547055.1 COX15/CtaA family protein [Hymenobacter translucens]
MESPAFVQRFRLVGLLTVVSIYLLILVGGIVRSTGSGMGCPDWPRCFGKWIPPTRIEQLPAGYKEVYAAQRVAKNQKLARTLERFGFHQVAANIFRNPSQYIETDFNPTKTWIEYLNRLLGALIGIFVFLTVVLALPYWRRDRAVFWLAFWSFILTGVQGWLGSLVVSTNLLPVMVTIHMGLALLIVGMLLYAVNRSQREQEGPQPVSYSGALLLALGGAVLLTFVQIVIGTQVREEVDMVAFGAHYADRAAWVEQLGNIFRFHRSFSILLVLVNGYVAYRLYQLGSARLNRLATFILVLLVLEVVAGITLAYLALPALVQPVHLTLATVLFGVQFLAFVELRRAMKSRRQPAYPSVVA